MHVFFFFNQTGPVDVLSPQQTSPTRIGPPARAAHRPRATTESGPRRHITIDYPSQREENEELTNEIPSSIIKSEGESGERKRPTIIKYSGQGRDVFVSGMYFQNYNICEFYVCIYILKKLLTCLQELLMDGKK